MAGKDDSEPPAAPPQSRVDEVLNGAAGEMAIKLKATIDLVLIEPVEAAKALKTAQSLAGLARAAIALQQMQAQEDKAADRALQRTAALAVAAICVKTGAGARRTINPDEDDHTDMNERDPRLDSPEGVAEIYEDAERAVARIARRLETKALERAADKGRGADGAGPVARPGEGQPAPAH